jgi:Na+:H+ antiporter, NhaA family
VKEKVKHIIIRFHPRRISGVLATFLKDESIGGRLILIGALVALIIANSSFHAGYENFWHLVLSVGVGDWNLAMDLRHWVNEGLMAIFFLVVGLEIKRELVHGELREFRKAILPVGAAIGGMVIPALIYVSLNWGSEASRGWGIPIATDIAFALGFLTLLGRRVPLSLKIFLLTLAIADDIGAIFVVALFYAEIIHYGFLFASFVLVFLMWLFRKKFQGRLFLFGVLGMVLWVTTHLSGIHASIIGAALGLITPLSNKITRHSMVEELERIYLPVSTFVVLPIFALANAGVPLSARVFTDDLSLQVMSGIILGLVFGKALGITIAAWLLVRFAKAELPRGTRWSQIIGIGFIAGIGFTVSIFITELAFGSNVQLVETAKISIFIASALSAVLGALVLHKAKREESQY